MVDMKWLLFMTLICISLVTNDVDLLKFLICLYFVLHDTYIHVLLECMLSSNLSILFTNVYPLGQQIFFLPYINE